MAEGIMEIASLKDPVGQVKELVKRPNGLLIGKMSVPMGVIGIIYEARPNVTSDCAALCIKSGNAIILRGGSEAIHSNQAIYDAIREAGVSAGLPENSINFISSTDREAVDALLELTGIVDLVIPRGGESLIAEVVKKARVPVIKTL
jgi:glutamate-5-semialdehyde dehydrogenase